MLSSRIIITSHGLPASNIYVGNNEPREVVHESYFKFMFLPHAKPETSVCGLIQSLPCLLKLKYHVMEQHFSTFTISGTSENSYLNKTLRSLFTRSLQVDLTTATVCAMVCLTVLSQSFSEFNTHMHVLAWSVQCLDSVTSCQYYGTCTCIIIITR